MIDWYSVGFSALWILGLGLVVVALSFANYLAGQHKWRFRQAFEVPACKIMMDLGLVFFCLGWAGGVSSTWERIVWAVLALMFALQAWRARKNQRMKLTPGTGEKALGKEPHAAPSALQRWGLGSWQLWIGVVFNLGFLWLALRDVDLRETANALRRVNVPILGVAVASYVLSAAAKAIRWQLLLATRNAPSFGRAFSVLSVGVMVNNEYIQRWSAASEDWCEIVDKKPRQEFVVEQ